MTLIHPDHCALCENELVVEEDFGHIRLNNQPLCVLCADDAIDEAYMADLAADARVHGGCA